MKVVLPIFLVVVRSGGVYVEVVVMLSVFTVSGIVNSFRSLRAKLARSSEMLAFCMVGNIKPLPSLKTGVIA